MILSRAAISAVMKGGNGLLRMTPLACPVGSAFGSNDRSQIGLHYAETKYKSVYSMSTLIPNSCIQGVANAPTKGVDLKECDLPNGDGRTAWSYEQRRVGVVGIKMGMTQIWDEWGAVVPVTIVHVKEVQVVRTRFNPANGHYMCEVGAVDVPTHRIAKSRRSHLSLNNVHTAKRVITEFPVSLDAAPIPGTFIPAAHFVAGQFVDVTAPSIGKGFQGGMKKWGFKGLGASHGVSKKHRALGSVGQCQDPGKVWPGKKMAGRMGGYQRTAQNLQVVKVDTRQDILYLKGSLPGHDEQYLKIYDSKKKQVQRKLFPSYLTRSQVPFPTLMSGAVKDLPRELVVPEAMALRSQDPFDKKRV